MISKEFVNLLSSDSHIRLSEEYFCKEFKMSINEGIMIYLNPMYFLFKYVNTYSIHTSALKIEHDDHT